MQSTVFPPSPPHPTAGQFHPQGIGTGAVLGMGSNNSTGHGNIGIHGMVSSAAMPASWSLGTAAVNSSNTFLSCASSASATALLQTKVRKASVQFTTQFQGISGFPAFPGVPTMSPNIELQDHTWRLVLFPGGVDENAKGYISCFLQCLSPENTRAIYRLSIVNQMGWKNLSVSSEQVRIFQGQSASTTNDEPLTEYESCPIPLLSQRNHSLSPCIFHGEDKFIAWNELKQSSNGHCVEDCLVIRADIVIYGGIEKNILSSPNPFLQISRQFDAGTAIKSQSALSPSTLMSSFPLMKDQLAMMFNNKQCSDFVVKVVSRKHDSSVADADQDGHHAESSFRYLHLHKFILGMRSPVFKAMLYDCAGMREWNSHELVIMERIAGDTCSEESPMQNKDYDFFVSYESLHEFFFFLYTDSCHMEEALPKYAQELLALACKYQVEGLRYICENYLAAMLAPSNAMVLLEMADTFGSEGLKCKALVFIAQNLKSILTAVGTTDGNHDHVEMNMSALLASLDPRLCIEVLQAVAGIHPFQMQCQRNPQDASAPANNRRNRTGSRSTDQLVPTSAIIMDQL